MIRYIAILLVLSTTSSPAFAAGNTNSIDVDIPKTRILAPEFSLTQNGISISLSEYTGKIIILNFWSLECKPCRDEMGSLDALSRYFHDQGLRVLAISIGDDLERINQFTKDKNYSIIFLVDETRELRKKYKINAVPVTYVIGRDGKFLARFVGARNWSHTDIKRFIESIL